MDPMKELMHRLRSGKFKKSYETIRGQCKGSHGLVQQPSANPGAKARRLALEATKNR
jgi:hypothetical protein